ncbi:MAG TPA: alcohol dehydrogenase catalytic domain-containing protein, partial [Acidimicrobiales bacterium]
MRAAVCRAYGPPEAVSVEDVPAPALAADQVRVRVAAAAVNFPDVLVVADSYQMSAPLPFVPGSELAGVVTEVGDDVVGFTIGDRVMGTTFVGAFAEEAVLGATALRPVPDGVDLRTAAAFGV